MYTEDLLNQRETVSQTQKRISGPQKELKQNKTKNWDRE